MIASLEGEVLAISDLSMVINVNGVGFKVNCPESFVLEHGTGDNIFVFTQLIVRENDLSLYGFGTEEERKFFNLLLMVDGIGPKAALNTLSKLALPDLQYAIVSENIDLLSKVPGIGRKTAQKISLYLKDKVSSDTLTEPIQSKVNENQVDLLSALTNLGYTQPEAQKAIQHLPFEPKLSLEESLLACLNYLQKF
ncbi:MAG TPA: Holliday junction branch migration protein RuvA [Anaerolineales bacterium]|nr:Holliday junction branch migration protein RuvA [Anaerolineales bacterium]